MESLLQRQECVGGKVMVDYEGQDLVKVAVAIAVSDFAGRQAFLGCCQGAWQVVSVDININGCDNERTHATLLGSTASRQLRQMLHCKQPGGGGSSHYAWVSYGIQLSSQFFKGRP
jgi:hypothetical protein